MCDSENTKFPKPADKLLEKKLPFSPHFLTPAGMLLPIHQQPPPMYGPRGTTLPPKFIPKYENINSQPNYKAPHTQRRAPCRPSEPVLPPRNWDLWCETCDRDFPCKAQMESHQGEHKTCGIAGCKFTGHPSIMERHVKQQHESGLFEKLKNVDSPEDIAKWRADRRKNYPTRENIDLKQMAREARKERGEKLDDTNKKFDRNQKQNPSKKNRRNKQKKPRGDKNKTKTSTEELQTHPEDTTTTNQGVPMFRGTAGMWDDEGEEKVEMNSNPLLKLIGMYGDSDESEAEEEIASPSNDQTTTLNGDYLKNQPVAKNVTEEGSRVETSRKRKLVHQEKEHVPQLAPKKVAKSGLNYGSLRKAKPNTLLFKLLQGEIRHERNVLLQAVRFVVENNFLEEEKQ